MSVIEMTNLHKSYGKVEALDGIDLAIDEGELVALLGPNGAGKTTLFELTLGLATPTSGALSVLGRRPRERANLTRVGAMLQHAGLPENVTVTELLRLVGHSYPRSLPIGEVLERVGLTTRAKRVVTALSGGERQRLLLGAAIVGSPDLLLLDEPTAALDADGRRSFWAEARSAVEDGTTVLFATHDLSEADAIARRVIVLRAGRVVADTTPEEMKRRIHGKTVSLRTTLRPAQLADLPGGGPVEVDETTGRLWIHTPTPELLVATMLERGLPFHDLEVAQADLEAAFLSLTADEEKERL